MRQYLSLLSRTGLLLIGSLVTFVSVGNILHVAPAWAGGGIGISGSFYQQSFEIPQGSRISGPDVYVVVFNNSSELFKVKMTSQTPQGVNLVFSINEFTLPASGQLQILVGVEVGKDAVPGSYDITITAEPYKETGTGIQLVGAASQKARLTVMGDSGTVSIQATSPDKQPMEAMVRLYRVVSGQEREVAYSEKGALVIKVAPGTFKAALFMGGEKLAEERLDIAAGQNRSITLSGATVYFEGFDVVPNYQKSDDKLAFVQIVYAVKNLYQRVDQGEVFLDVSLNGAAPAEQLLATLSPLETGRAGLNYNYIPAGGWENGEYGFKLRLNLDGKPYASSLAKQLTVGGRGDGTGGTSPYLIGGVVAAVLIVAVIVFFFVRKTQRG